jgi:hypothetical protein
MHDLRYDHDDPKPKPAAAFAAMREQFGAAFDAMDPAAHAADPRVMRAADLRTVPMPDLRSGTARELDAQARGLDTRTFDEQVIAELVRIVDALQGISLRLDIIEETLRGMVRDFCALQDGVYFVPNYGIDAIDKFYYLNHSRKPNMITKDKGETFVAKRNIKTGEELTADYRLYHDTKSFKT